MREVRWTAVETELLPMTNLENKIPPPVVMLLFGALMWGMSLIGPQLSDGQLTTTALVPSLFLFGLIISLAGVYQFRISATTVNPLRPDKASKLVTKGVFTLTRNPMYLGMLVWLIAWSLFLNSSISLLGVMLFFLFITRFQIVPEERAMQALFGAEFELYQSKVRRWI